MSPLTCCNNAWLFVTIFFVAPFFLVSFFVGIISAMELPGIIEDTDCCLIPCKDKSSPNEERGCGCKMLLCFFNVLCIFPFMALMVTLMWVGLIFNTVLTVILLLPRLIYLAFLWYRWTWKRNLLVRRTS